MPLTAESAPMIYAKAALLARFHVEASPDSTPPMAIPSWVQIILDLLTQFGICGLTTGSAIEYRVKNPHWADPFKVRLALWRHGFGFVNDAAHIAIYKVGVETPASEWDAMLKEASAH